MPILLRSPRALLARLLAASVVAIVATSGCFDKSSSSGPSASFDGSTFDVTDVPDASSDIATSTAPDAGSDATDDQTVPPVDATTPDASAGQDGAVDANAGLDASAGVDASPPVDAAAPGDGGDGGAMITAGNALAFDDTVAAEYVTVPNGLSLDRFGGDMTWEAWVDVTGPGHTTTWTVMGKPYGSGNGDTVSVWLGAGALYAGVNASSTSVAINAAWSAAYGTWHHLALTYAQSTQIETLYVDGVAIAQQPNTTGAPLFDGNPVVIGSDIDNGAYTFGIVGVIDDVRIYSSVRTPAQIADDMAFVSPLGNPSLEAYYTFDEGSGLVAHDSSPNHYDGQLSIGAGPDAAGTTPTWVPSTVPIPATPTDAGVPATYAPDASYDTVLEFDPTLPAYVAVADNPKLELTSAFTLEVWVELDASVASSVVSILGKPVNGGAEDSYGMWFQAGVLYAGVNVNNSGNTASYAWSLPSGAWHHLAFTFDGTSNAETLYVDGVSVGMITNPNGTPTYDSHPFLLGADINYGAIGYGFSGLMSDVRIFSAARNAGQIAADMTGGSPLGDPTLVAYYPLDAGSGNTATDQSPNALDGTLGNVDAGTGSPQWVQAPPPPF